MLKDKFRVWDSERKIMIYDSIGDYDIFINLKGDVIERLGYEIAKGGSNLIIMKYIGSKDKNRVDIHEGDIIELKGHDILHPKIIDIEEVFMSLDNGCYCHTYRDRPSKRFWKYAKVIGNIYQDKELLK